MALNWVASSPEPTAAPQGGFGNSLARGVDQTQMLLYSAVETLGSGLGFDAVKRWGEEGVAAQLEQLAANPPEVESWDDVHSLADAGTWFLERLGEQLPNMALDITAGVATAGGGALLSAVARRGTMSVAERAAIGKALKRAVGFKAFGSLEAQQQFKKRAMAGALVSAGAQMVGESRQSQLAEGVDSPLLAILTGGAKTALEGQFLHKLMGVAEKLHVPPESVAKAAWNAVKAAADVSGWESLVEGAQTFLDQASVKLERGENYKLFSRENWNELSEAMLVGGAVGGALGGATAAASELHAYRQAAKQTSQDLDNTRLPDPEQEDSQTDFSSLQGRQVLEPLQPGDEGYEPPPPVRERQGRQVLEPLQPGDEGYEPSPPVREPQGRQVLEPLQPGDEGYEPPPPDPMAGLQGRQVLDAEVPDDSARLLNDRLNVLSLRFQEEGLSDEESHELQSLREALAPGSVNPLAWGHVGGGPIPRDELLAKLQGPSAPAAILPPATEQPPAAPTRGPVGPTAPFRTHGAERAAEINAGSRFNTNLSPQVFGYDVGAPSFATPENTPAGYLDGLEQDPKTGMWGPPRQAQAAATEQRQPPTFAGIVSSALSGGRLSPQSQKELQAMRAAYQNLPQNHRVRQLVDAAIAGDSDRMAQLAMDTVGARLQQIEDELGVLRRRAEITQDPRARKLLTERAIPSAEQRRQEAIDEINAKFPNLAEDIQAVKEPAKRATVAVALLRPLIQEMEIDPDAFAATQQTEMDTDEAAPQTAFQEGLRDFTANEDEEQTTAQLYENDLGAAAKQLAVEEATAPFITPEFNNLQQEVVRDAQGTTLSFASERAAQAHAAEMQNNDEVYTGKFAELSDGNKLKTSTYRVVKSKKEAGAEQKWHITRQHARGYFSREEADTAAAKADADFARPNVVREVVQDKHGTFFVRETMLPDALASEPALASTTVRSTAETMAGPPKADESRIIHDAISHAQRRGQETHRSLGWQGKGTEGRAVQAQRNKQNEGRVVMATPPGQDKAVPLQVLDLTTGGMELLKLRARSSELYGNQYRLEAFETMLAELGAQGWNVDRASLSDTIKVWEDKGRPISYGEMKAERTQRRQDYAISSQIEQGMDTLYEQLTSAYKTLRDIPKEQKETRREVYDQIRAVRQRLNRGREKLKAHRAELKRKYPNDPVQARNYSPQDTAGEYDRILEELKARRDRLAERKEAMGGLSNRWNGWMPPGMQDDIALLDGDLERAEDALDAHMARGNTFYGEGDGQAEFDPDKVNAQEDQKQERQNKGETFSNAGTLSSDDAAARKAPGSGRTREVAGKNKNGVVEKTAVPDPVVVTSPDSLGAASLTDKALEERLKEAKTPGERSAIRAEVQRARDAQQFQAIGLGDKLSKDALNFLADIMDELGINKNLKVALATARMSNLDWLYHNNYITGAQLAEVEQRLRQKGTRAVFVGNGPRAVIIIKEGLSNAEALEAVGHEMGHGVLNAVRNRITPEQHKRLQAAYKREKYDGPFDEWFADKVFARAKNLAESAKDGNDSIFKRTATLLRQLWQGLAARFKVNKSFNKFIDELKASGALRDATGFGTTVEAMTVHGAYRSLWEGMLKTPIKELVTRGARIRNLAGGGADSIYRAMYHEPGTQYDSSRPVPLVNAIEDARARWERSLGGPLRIFMRYTPSVRQRIARELSIGQTANVHQGTREMREFLNRFYHGYLRDRMPNLGWAKNYFPRKWNLEQIRERMQEFQALAQRHGVQLSNDPYSLIDKAIHEDEALADLQHYQQAHPAQMFLTESFMRDRGSFPAAFISEAYDAGFLNTEPALTLVHYMNNAIRRAEWERAFGGEVVLETAPDGTPTRTAWDPNVKLNEMLGQLNLPAAKKRELRELIQGAVLPRVSEVHELATELGDKVVREVMAFESLRTLMGSGLASLPEPAVAFLRSKGAMDFNEFSRQLGDAFNNADDINEALELLGVMESNEIAAMMQELPELGGKARKGVLPKALPYLFKFNGNEGVVRFSKRVAYLAAVHSLKTWARQAQGTGVKADRAKRYLKELNIHDPALVDQWVTNGSRIPTAGSTDPADQAVASAIRSFIYETVMQPKGINRPEMADHPYGRLLFHLKSFLYEFHANVNTGVWNELAARAGERRADPTAIGDYGLFVMAAALPLLVLAGLGEELRRRLFSLGEKGAWEHARKDPLQLALNLHDRTGLGQIPFVSDLIRNPSVDGLLFAAGPTVQHGFTLAQAAVSGDPQEVKRAVAKTPPVASQVPAVRKAFYDATD